MPRAAHRKSRKSKNATINPTGTLNTTEATIAPPSPSALLSHSQLTTEEWYRSAKTTRAYASYVKSGKEFLKSWAEDGTGSQGGESDSLVDSDSRDTFVGAFDSITSRTPIALRLFLAYKCDHQQKGFSTAEGLRSAFKQYFER